MIIITTTSVEKAIELAKSRKDLVIAESTGNEKGVFVVALRDRFASQLRTKRPNWGYRYRATADAHIFSTDVTSTKEVLGQLIETFPKLGLATA